eukprot:g58809.t1
MDNPAAAVEALTSRQDKHRKQSSEDYRAALRRDQENKRRTHPTVNGILTCKIVPKIIGTEKCKYKTNDKLHINYIIQVTTGIAGLQWNVHRRYRKFVQFHEELIQRFDKKDLPLLPGKTLTGRKLNDSHTEDRAQKLDEYLSVLANNTRVAKSDIFCSFLAGTFEDLLLHAQTSFDQLQAAQALSMAACASERTVAKALEDIERYKMELEREKMSLSYIQTGDQELHNNLQATEEAYALQTAKIEELEAAKHRKDLQNQNEISRLQARIKDLEHMHREAADESTRTIQSLKDILSKEREENISLTARNKQLQADRRLLKQAVRQLRMAHGQTPSSNPGSRQGSRAGSAAASPIKPLVRPT